jgi:hypothetical protein
VWWQEPAAPATRPPAAPRAARDGRNGWHWLLLIALLPPLCTPLYNRVEPAVAGVPFFYWFQLALVGLEVAVLTLVHQVTKRPGRP